MEDDQLGNTSSKFEGAAVGSDPGLKILARSGFGINLDAGFRGRRRRSRWTAPALAGAKP